MSEERILDTAILNIYTGYGVVADDGVKRPKI